MNKYVGKRTKLTETDIRLLVRYRKASKNFNDLKKMNANTEFMASSMAKLLKVFDKMETIQTELKTEILTLKDAGGKALELVNTNNRVQRTKRQNYWNDNHSPDVKN